MSRDGFEASKIKLYPNPVENNVTISQQEVIDGITVYNLLGQKVLMQKFASNEVSVNLESLSAGAYLLEVSSAGIQKTTKIVKK